MAAGATKCRLDFAQTLHGNWVWFVMIYKMLKGTASEWRRCLQGIDTTSKGDTMGSPDREGENEQAAIRKHRKDNAVNIFCLKHLLKVKDGTGEGQGRDTVSLTALQVLTHKDIHNSKMRGRITGGAAKLGWSVMNPDEREALMIPMPKPMQDAISKAGKLPEGHPLRDFIIAVAELAVCPMAQMQWGHLWRDRSFPLVLFNTDNHNSYSWLHTMFANNELAREVCRLIATLCFTEEHTIRSLWWPTYVNNLADLISRMLDENGNEIPSVREEFEVDNAQLEHPYRILTPDEWNPRISHFVDWLGGLEHAFSALENIPLQADLFEAPTKQVRGGSMNVGQSVMDKKESGSESVRFTNPEITTFWEPALSPSLIAEMWIESKGRRATHTMPSQA